MSKFNNLRSEIIELYQLDKSVADDDKLLISKIWNNHGWNWRVSLYENLKNMPSAESIRRTRQKLVAEGIMKPSDKATEVRYQAYKDYYKEFYESTYL